MFEEATYPLPMRTPKFLGYTVNDFSINKGKAAKAFQSVINEIDLTVKDVLLPSFAKMDMLLPSDAYREYRLADIPNFATLMALYQDYGVPVFELSDEMLGKTGIVLENQQKRREDFKTKFSNFADEVLRLMDYAESH
jgi:hypothetical protein